MIRPTDFAHALSGYFLNTFQYRKDLAKIQYIPIGILCPCFFPTVKASAI